MRAPMRLLLNCVKYPVTAVFLLSASMTSQGASITYDAGGKVTGLSGLIVGTTLYDVQFKLGTFGTVYGSAAAFDFTTVTSAQQAREAIRSVLNAAGSPFLALTNPATNLDPTGWAFSIPYDIIAVNPPLRSAAAGYSAALASDKYASTATWADFDNVSGSPPVRVSADFSAAVPVPAAGLLFASGLIGLHALRSRRYLNKGDGGIANKGDGGIKF